MANLLRTEWYKLWHSWYFWGIGIFTFFFSSILLLDSKGKTSNLVMASLYNTPLLYFLIIVFIALFIGRPLIHAFAESKFGHICMLSSEKVDNAEKYFDKHGSISTFLGRLIPAVRQLISIPAGLSRMSILPFILYTSLGPGIWNSVLAALGYWLSLFVPEQELFNQIEHYNKYLTMAGYGLALIIVLYILYHIFINKKK